MTPDQKIKLLHDICAVPECEGRQRAKGFCNRHYLRLRAHGDPNGGGTSPGETMKFIKEVALIHPGDDCLHWPFAKDGHGYGILKVGRKTGKAHRFVCDLVNGPPPTRDHQAAHSCGNGHLGCVSPKHLSWKTRTENAADKHAHGTHTRGERHGPAKLTEDQAREILRLKGVLMQSEIAAVFGVSRPTVSSIHRRVNWSWLGE